MVKIHRAAEAMLAALSDAGTTWIIVQFENREIGGVFPSGELSEVLAEGDAATAGDGMSWDDMLHLAVKNLREVESGAPAPQQAGFFLPVLWAACRGPNGEIVERLGSLGGYTIAATIAEDAERIHLNVQVYKANSSPPIALILPGLPGGPQLKH